MSARQPLLILFCALLCGGAIATGLLVLPQDRQMPAMPTQTQGHDRSEAASQATPDGALDMMTATQPATYTPSEKRRGDLDPVEARARVEANIATLDTRFAAETPDAAWAMREERALGAFFAADALAAQGLPAPDGLQIACRSATCRISARFADPVEAEMTTQRLAMHVATDLPYRAVMPRALDDGSIRVEAWYSSTRIAL